MVTEQMSVKIKISYTTKEELEQVLQVLSPVIKNYKISKNQEGRYKKVYVEVKHWGSPSEAWEIQIKGTLVCAFFMVYD